MSGESTRFDAYDVVLADLRAKRDQIEQAIAAIEAIRSGGVTPVAVGTSKVAPEAAAYDPGAYLGMSIAEATKKLLASQKRQMSNSEILAALKAGGLVLTSADPLNTIGAVITRRFKEVGDIVRIDRGVWGLKEWYPNRSFRPKNGDDTKASTSAPVQPSEPLPDAVPASDDQP